MKAEYEFGIPDEFEEYLDQHEVKRQGLVEKKEEERKRKERAGKRKKTAHRKRTKEELEYAEFIFGWVNEFRESSAGKRAIAAVPTSSRPDRDLIFFQWHPGWTYGLNISGKRIEWWRAGPGSKHVYCETPEELAWQASGPTPGMLEACCEAIGNGEIWKWIKRDLALFVDKDLFFLRGDNLTEEEDGDL